MVTEVDYLGLIITNSWLDLVVHIISFATITDRINLVAKEDMEYFMEVIMAVAYIIALATIHW